MKLIGRLSLRLPQFMIEKLRKLAESKHSDISDVAREVIALGMSEVEKQDVLRNKCSLFKSALSKYLAGNTQALTDKEILALGYLVHNAYENSRTGTYYDVSKVYKLVEFVYNTVESVKDEGIRNYIYSNVLSLGEYRKAMPFANIGANYPARAFLACIEEGDQEKVKEEILKIIDIVLEIASVGILHGSEECNEKQKCIEDLHKFMWNYVEEKFLSMQKRKDIMETPEVKGFGNENVHFSILFSEYLPCRIRLSPITLPVNLWVLLDLIHLIHIYETKSKVSEPLKIDSLFWELMIDRKRNQGWITLKIEGTNFINEFSIELKMKSLDDLVDAANKFKSWLSSEDLFARAISHFRLIYGEI